MHIPWICIEERKYQAKFGGEISISFHGSWSVPWDDTDESEITPRQLLQYVALLTISARQTPRDH